MKIQISPSEATALKEALDESFKTRSSTNGRSTITMEGLHVGGNPVPPGTTVWFVPTADAGYGKHYKPTSRAADHAVITLDMRRGSSITVSGSYTELTARNCA